MGGKDKKIQDQGVEIAKLQGLKVLLPPSLPASLPASLWVAVLSQAHYRCEAGSGVGDGEESPA